MLRYLLATLGSLALAVGLAVGMVNLAVDSAHGAQPRTKYVACYTESDTDCVWDARHRGNGMGQSFYAAEGGRIYPLPHHIAHFLLGLPTPPA